MLCEANQADDEDEDVSVEDVDQDDGLEEDAPLTQGEQHLPLQVPAWL